MSAISQFVPLPVLRKLLRQHPVAARYRARVRSRLLFSSCLEPFRLYERFRFGRRIRETRIDPSPVFLLGYGRSGTTHLHYLLWRDPQFGVVSNYLANMYPVALMGQGWLEKFFADKIPSRRPMDNVAISLDAPQEEEIALVNSSEHAPLHFMSFPKALPEIYDRYITDLGHDAAVLEAWQRAYLEVLKKATLLGGGKRLLLKTPTHTGRVRVLRDMFPEAKFVHIVRNPYRVYRSMRNMYRKILPAQVFQEFDWAEIDAWVLSAYRVVMLRYLEDRKRLDSKSLFEIRYEELDERPLPVLEQMYRRLGLGDFEGVRPDVERYLESLGTFEKNQFEFSDEDIDAVNEHWGFALDAFGYERIEAGQSPD